MKREQIGYVIRVEKTPEYIKSAEALAQLENLHFRPTLRYVRPGEMPLDEVPPDSMRIGWRTKEEAQEALNYRTKQYENEKWWKDDIYTIVRVAVIEEDL